MAAGDDLNWEWKDDRAWKKYDATTCRMLTLAAEKSKVTTPDNSYEIDLKSMKQKNKSTGYERQVRCNDSAEELASKRAAMTGGGSTSDPGQLSAKEEKEIQALFTKYKESDRSVGPEGVMSMLADLNLEPTSVEVLCLAWKLDAERMGYFSKDEFFRGFRALKVSSIAALGKALTKVKESLSDKATFVAMHKFAFNYSRDEGQKSVPVTTACGMLPIVLGNKKKHTAQFVEYLGVQTDTRVLSLDTWTSFLEFSDVVNLDCSNFDGDEWPTLYDEYATWVRAKKK